MEGRKGVRLVVRSRVVVTSGLERCYIRNIDDEINKDHQTWVIKDRWDFYYYKQSKCNSNGRRGKWRF